MPREVMLLQDDGVMVVNKQLKGLLYKDNDSYYPLPHWGMFYIDLGQTISQFISCNTRLVIALSVPTRTYCASLISLGFIAWKASNIDEADYLLHAEYLKSLPGGTPVRFRSQSRKKFNGIYQGCFKRGNQIGFLVKTDKEYATEWFIRIEDSKKIEVLDKEKTELPPTQKGRSITPSSQFCSKLLGSHCANRFITLTNLEEVIIGPKNILRKEITDGLFATRGKIVGTLQEILKIREFQSSTASYRSIIISDRIKFNPEHSTIADPPLTIFDNCQGFLKWRNYWRGSSWVVVFDRTEYQFDSAIEQLNKEYIQNRVDKPTKITLSNIPAGIEVMIFKVSQ